MGDGSFNNLHYDGTYSNFIPTFQSSLSDLDGDSYISDDFYALLDDDEGNLDGKLDIGIGRIPCQTLEEADIVAMVTCRRCHRRPRT